jgi:hypothetical protein
MGFSFGGVFRAVVVAAAVAAVVYTGGASLGLLSASTLSAGMGSFVAMAALTTAVAATASQLMTSTQLQGQTFDIGSQLQGQIVSKREPAGNARVVYGQTRVGGTVLFMEASGAKNETMHIVQAISGHQIDSVQKVYVNDTEVVLSLSGNAYVGTYKGSATAVSFNWFLGTDNQSALPFLSGTSASAFQFKGISALASKMVYDANVFPQGLPSITAIVRGKRVYDPRTSTTAYSNNSALCIRDYLLDADFGLGAKVSEIDEDSFETAADICDENVNLNPSGTEKRYTLNGTYLSSEKPKDVLSKMLTSCGGILTYSGGKWVIKVATYRTPTVTISEDIIAGAVTMQASQSRRDIFNAVKGLYSEPTALYQPTSFPSVENNTYTNQDGEQIWKDIEYSFTTSSATCQRLAKIELEKSRQQIVFNVPCKLNAFEVQAGDNVFVDFPRYGWSNKIFEVLDWEFTVASEGQNSVPVVNLTLRETASQVYDWNSGEQTTVDFAPNTNLPDPFTVNPCGVAVSDTLTIIAETVQTTLIVDIAGTNTFQDRYEVEAKLSTDSTYIALGQASGTRFELPNAVDGATYNVRARTINSFNVKSTYTTANHVVVGKTAPPQNVTGFDINIVGAQAYLTWIAVPDLDLSHYRIRHSSETTGATYSNSIDLIAKVARPAVFAVAPAMTGTYFIKAIDKIGNESIAPAEVTAIIENIKDLNVVETVTESPTFAGQKVECSVNEFGQLILDTSIDFDSATGNFDDRDGDFDGGGGFISTEGTYYFYNVVDLGSVYTSRVTSNLVVSRADYVNLFDDVTGNFDNREGLFDGDPNTYGDTNVELYVSVTNDDPNSSPVTWSDWRKFYVGDYKARGLRFKAILTSTSGESSPVIQSLSVTVDMPDRVIGDNDLVSGTGAGGYAVTYSPAFKVSPSIGIMAQNLAQGDFYEIPTKSASGFTIRFKNSSGTVVSRTFDYVAKGYGELVT